MAQTQDIEVKYGNDTSLIYHPFETTDLTWPGVTVVFQSKLIHTVWLLVIQITED